VKHILKDLVRPTSIFLRRPVIALLLAALAPRLVIAWFPCTYLIQFGPLIDDSFYCFSIARNIAFGLGFTFDTLAPTNGYHPLWIVLITPIYMLTHDVYLPIHWILTLSAIVDTAAVYFLYKLLQRFLPPRAAWLGCLVYAFSPHVLFSVAGPMNGLETALNICLILAYSNVFITLVRKTVFPLIAVQIN
jgi:hypothetical protein